MRLRVEIPDQATQYGFMQDPVGTHGSRTMMLSELQALLANSPPEAKREQLREAILGNNILLKKTLATRKESFRRLRELYALDPQILLYRALRELWSSDLAAQPLLALLCAAARDALLRATAEAILATPVGGVVTPYELSAATERAFPGRYNPTMLANVGRHTASSWQQSGHLVGRLRKTRAEPVVRPPAVAYALLLGHLCETRGQALLRSFWARLLAAPEHVVREQARSAAQQGWVEYRDAAGVIDVSFSFLLKGRVAEGPS